MLQGSAEFSLDLPPLPVGLAPDQQQQYVDAIRDGESPQDAREAWTRLQASRRENGFTVQPLSELLKSAQNSRKQERQTMNGVQYDKGNRGFAEQLGRI